METKRSIQDIQPSHSRDNITEIIVDKPVKRRTKRTIAAETIEIPKEEPIIDNNGDNINLDDIALKPKYKKSRIKRLISMIGYIKPFYLITFTIIIVAIIILIFVPGKPKDVNEQTKKEAIMVKKELAKHMILPKDEELDIRKITNKVDDPFFKDAEIGDYLILFYKNRIAYIYSVDKDLIVNAGVIFIDPKTATTTKSQ